MAKSIGKQLHEARMARGLDLEDVQHKTRIPVRRLSELENDDYSNFANRTYAKGFLNIYGSYLKVDLSEFLSGFQVEGLRRLSSYAYLQPATESLRRKSPATSPDPRRGSALVVVVLLLTLIVGGPLWYWNHHGGNPGTDSGTASPPAVTTTSSSPATTTAPPSERPYQDTTSSDISLAPLKMTPTPVNTTTTSPPLATPFPEPPVLKAEPVLDSDPVPSATTRRAEVRKPL